MQRARGLALLAAGLLVTGLVSGCRTDPRVAVYLDSGNITESTVDSVMEKLNDAVKATNDHVDKVVDDLTEQVKNGVDPATLPTPPARVKTVPRNQLVAVLAADRVCDGYWTTLRTTDSTVPAAPPQKYSEADLAGAKNIPAGEFAKTWADLGNCLDAVGDKVGAGTKPTEADYRDVFDRAVAAGLATNADYAAVRPQLEQLTDINHYVAQRNVLAAQATTEHIKTNPRYRPLEFPLMTISTNDNRTFEAVSLPIGGADNAVPVSQL